LQAQRIFLLQAMYERNTCSEQAVAAADDVTYSADQRWQGGAGTTLSMQVEMNA
jgi:hypothetical protein